ncbi:kinase-like protein, partial [Obba rivulosa]
LKKLCRNEQICPVLYTLPSGAVRLSGNGRPSAFGGFADVWEGELGKRRVAVKAMRQLAELNIQDLCLEAVVWKSLRHPNVTDFFGIYHNELGLCLVSEWMPHGTVTEYLKKNPSGNRLKLASIIMDVTKGLSYLHQNGIIHGDIKGTNILIDARGEACLTDFGLATLSYSNKLPTGSAGRGCLRYMAPELMDPESIGLGKATLSLQSDIYSFGMTMWEIFSGDIPFSDCRQDATVILRVCKGERPKRLLGTTTSAELPNGIWELIQRCWQPDPEKRPEVADILECVESVLVVQ